MRDFGRRAMSMCTARYVVAVAIAAVGLGPPAIASADANANASDHECPAGVALPAGDWPVRSDLAATRAKEIAALEQYAFTLTGKDEERKGIRTDAVLIVQGGRVVYERYARGFDPSKRHLTWSISKSVLDVVTGAAVGRGLIAEGDSICKHLPAARVRPTSCPVTVGDLLAFGSGLAWKEVYENESNQASSVLAMLYGEGHADMAAFVAGHEVRDPPGASWRYSSGDTTLLAGVLDGALRPTLGEAFAWKLVFEPLGVRSAAWERDVRGTLVGSSYLYATARDLARVGWLYLHDGCHAGTRLVPAGWVARSTSVPPAFLGRALRDGAKEVPGRQWWVNRAVPERDVPAPWPSAPADAFAALGHWGQSMTVIPSLDLLIVRFGDDRETGALDLDRFLALAIAVGRAP